MDHMVLYSYTAESLDDTKRLADSLCDHIVKGDLLALVGPVGAGKSVLSRFIVRNLCNNPVMDVPSPTFNLVQGYKSALFDKSNIHDFDILHCDLYRLQPGDSLEDLLIEEMSEDALIIVEWPDRLPPDMLSKSLAIRITPRVEKELSSDPIQSASEKRQIDILGAPSRWKKRIAGLEKAMENK